LADHKQHPRRALEGRRDHDGLARNGVTKSTFVVLISIVNAATDQSGVRRLKKMRCVGFATLLSHPNGLATRGGSRGPRHACRVCPDCTPRPATLARRPPCAPVSLTSRGESVCKRAKAQVSRYSSYWPWASVALPARFAREPKCR